MAEDWVLGVSDLNEYVRRTLAADPMLRSLRLRGEISNFKRHSSGHWYFTLKDERSRINCVMFRQNAMRMSIRPSDGMAVIVSGSVSLYAEGGAYQFYAESMRPDGVGGLYAMLEALKAKLLSEGLFDQGRKRPLPLRPRRIAVVTSETGAVLQDIRRVAGHRDPGVPLVLLPVQVQGEGAAVQIARAIRKAGTLPEVDVIITGRGGGSMEDLWAFNEEAVVRAIADSPVPVISAVGHETDFTLADMAADQRASTPSNAAEFAVPERSELLAVLAGLRRQLEHEAGGAVDTAKLRLMRIEKQLNALRPDHQSAVYAKRISLCRIRLDQAVDRALGGAVTSRIAVAQLHLTHAMDRVITGRQEQLRSMSTRLEAISPQRVLERGYAIVTSDTGVVTRASETPQRMTLRFQDGSVRVTKEEQHGSQEKAEL